MTTNYSWNVLGQLTGAGTDTYTYDNSGLRTTVNGAQQVYGQDMKLLSDGTNKFLWGIDGSLLAQAPLGATTCSMPLQAVTNSMGSVYEIVQSQPVVGTSGANQLVAIAQYTYSLFGERTLIAGTDATDIGYVSEQRDATTGFIYLRARYYDPKTAQFISSDPMLVKTLDEYGYASGNPLEMIDPLGLDALSDTIGWAWSVAKAVDQWVQDNPSTVSTGLVVLGVIAEASGLGAPIGIGLTLLSMEYARRAVVKDVSEGKTTDAVVDAIGIIPGAGFVTGSVGASLKTSIALAKSPLTRAEVKAASRNFDKLASYSENVGLSMTAVGLGRVCG